MTENEERFLLEIASRIPLSNIEEVHLFAPLRQGGTESGVAVVAATAELGPQAEPAPDVDAANAADSSERLRLRFVIYTARYRLAYKGPERGKWDFELAAEADAPLLTIDRVVSGVLERSGEQSEPVRLTASDIRASVGEVICGATKQ